MKMKRILKAIEKELKSLEEQIESRKDIVSRFFKEEEEYKKKIAELKDIIKLQKDELFKVKNMYDELLKEINNEKDN